MKCRVCRGPAVIDLKRHNANFCGEHFVRFCSQQVEKAIGEYDMFSPKDRLLIAVSGGKDSLAIWDILNNLGYEADGLYIGLGIDGYSDPSGEFAKSFAAKRGLKLIVVDITKEYGYDVPSGSRAAKRAPCSACGMSKRHIFDRVALEGGYDALITGHNLDDEAAVLFGNVLHWQTDYLARQHPVLPERNGLPRKVKPLVRLDEREMAAYCVIVGIDYMLDECPMAVGNKHIRYKEALNSIESASPGSKAAFFHKFLSQGAPFFQQAAEDLREGLNPCETCGQPTPNDICAFCRLVERAGGQPVPVQLTSASARSTTAPTPTASAAPQSSLRES